MMKADQSRQILEHLLGNIKLMITHAGDMSNLILDPDLDTYYLMDATLLSLPQAQEQLSQAMDDGETLMGNPQLADPALAKLHARILKDSALDHVLNSVETALREDGNGNGKDAVFQQQIPPVLSDYRDAVTSFVELTEHLDEADHSQITPEVYHAAAARARDAGMDLWVVCSRNLDRLLSRRIAAYESHRWMCLSITTLAVLAASLMVLFINRSINRPLKLQADALREANTSLTDEVSRRKEAQAQLLDASRRAGMAEIAAGVLHNVGNVLNSVNTSATVIREKLDESKVPILNKAAAMIQEHRAETGFLQEDPKGRQIPEFLSRLVDAMSADQQMIAGELSQLTRNVDHIKQIVQTQQAMAKEGAKREKVDLVEIVEDAVRICGLTRGHANIELIRDFQPCEHAMTDRHKLLQIMVNLITNSVKALSESSSPLKRITLSIKPVADTHPAARITVTDSGAGIAPENLHKIFQHGFTTRKDGHGFGLHTAAIDIRHMGGAMSVFSPGVGQGATFTVDLPLESQEVVEVYPS